MSVKKYKVTQTVKAGGKERYNTSYPSMDETSLTSFISTLEGTVEVWEMNTTLSRSATSAAEVTAYNVLVGVSLSVPDKSLWTSINPNGGGFIIKDGVNTDELDAIFKTANVFIGFPTEKPTRVVTKMIGGYTAN